MNTATTCSTRDLREAADVLREYADVLRESNTAAGAWPRTREGYNLRREHDRYLRLAAALDAWARSHRSAA